FQRVILAGLLVEDVDDDVAVILRDPAARLVAFNAESPVADVMQRGVNLFGEGVDLATTPAGDEDEIGVDGGDAPHVQHDDVAAFVVGGHTGTETSSVEGVRLSGRRRESPHCGLQETSFRAWAVAEVSYCRVFAERFSGRHLRERLAS